MLKADCRQYLGDILAIAGSLKLHENTTVEPAKKVEFVTNILDSMSGGSSDQLSCSRAVSMLGLLQTFGPQLAMAPYYYEEVLDSCREGWGQGVYCQLLTCCVGLLLDQPAAMQVHYSTVEKSPVVKRVCLFK